MGWRPTGTTTASDPLVGANNAPEQNTPVKNALTQNRVNETQTASPEITELSLSQSGSFEFDKRRYDEILQKVEGLRLNNTEEGVFKRFDESVDAVENLVKTTAHLVAGTDVGYQTEQSFYEMIDSENFENPIFNMIESATGYTTADITSQDRAEQKLSLFKGLAHGADNAYLLAQDQRNVLLGTGADPAAAYLLAVGDEGFEATRSISDIISTYSGIASTALALTGQVQLAIGADLAGVSANNLQEAVTKRLHGIGLASAEDVELVNSEVKGSVVDLGIGVATAPFGIVGVAGDAVLTNAEASFAGKGVKGGKGGVSSRLDASGKAEDVSVGAHLNDKLSELNSKANTPDRILDSNGNRIPHGFNSVDEFNQFTGVLAKGLPEGTNIVFQGSSVTGKSFKTGQVFDDGRVSDFDIGLVSDDLFLQSLELGRDFGFKVKTQPDRIGPLEPAQLELLKLKDLQTTLSDMAGRPVNFQLFDSLQDALKKDSIFVK